MDFQSEKSFGKLRLRAFQPYHQILCMSKHVEDVEDRSNTHKGCNAMYVEDIEDRSNLLSCFNIFDTFDIALISCIYVSQHPFNVHLRRLRHT